MRIPSIGHSAKQKSWDFFVGDLTADLTKAIELGQLLPFPLITKFGAMHVSTPFVITNFLILEIFPRT